MPSSVKDNIRGGAGVIRDAFQSLSRDRGGLFIIAVFTIVYLPQAFVRVNDFGLLSVFETDAGSHAEPIKSFLSSYNMNEGYHSQYDGWTFFAVNYCALWPLSKLMSIFHIGNMTYLYLTIRIILFLFGLLSCVFWYRLLRISFARSSIPVVGSLLYIVSPADDAYFYTVQPETTGATFLFLAALYLMTYLRSDNDAKLYYPAVVCMALASLSQPIFVLNSLPILFGFFHLTCRKRNIGYAGFFFSRDFLTGVGASIGLSLAIFFVIHPFAFLDFKSFIRAQFDLVNATGGEPAASAHKAFARWIRSLYSSHALPIVIGGLLIPPGLAVGVVSYVRRRDDRTLLFIVLCMTMIFVGASIIAFNHAHFAVESLSPVYPMGVLVMMAALDWILDSRARWLRLIAAGAACYLIAFSFLINSLDLAQALAARFQDQEPVAYAGEIRGKDDKCLDIPGGVTEDGTALDYRACSGAPGQQWTIKDGLIAGKDGRCIDIPEGKTTDGAVLNLWECEDGAEEQQWEMVRGALIGKDGVCIGLAGGRTDDGAPVQVSRCDGGAGQKWKY